MTSGNADLDHASPETPASGAGARMAELVEQGCQLLVATHSPILLALPAAAILEIAEDGQVELVDYDQALPVRLTRGFLADPHRYLRHLLAADPDQGCGV